MSLPSSIFRRVSLIILASSIVATEIISENSVQMPGDETVGRFFLESLEKEATERCHHLTLAEWNLASDITPANRAIATKYTMEYSKFWKQKWKESQVFRWESFQDPFLRRQFKLMATLGIAALPEETQKRYNTLKQKLESIYSTARICKPSDLSKCDLALEPEIMELMMYNRNETELRSVWLQWRNVSGKKMRKDFVELGKIMAEVAAVNKFPDVSSYETRFYESPHFLSDLEKLWTQLRPFYLELHAYVRWKLGLAFGVNVVPPSEPIPSHLFGNIWAQGWSNIFDLVTPYKVTRSIDATPLLIARNFTPRKMAEEAEKFFVSMGFPKLPPEFWAGSILEKIPDKEMVCHASAWDMCDQKDFRIKQCTRVNMEDFVTLHHEMGHTMYQIQYKEKPKLFRNGANAAFHEAIGDLISLSVQTPEHLYKIGLLEGVEESHEADINHLMLMALDKIAFLPYGLLVDKWRWGVFDGNISSEHYNCEWWKLRVQYQGVTAPEWRTEEDFDPCAKYHVASNIGYIRYFISAIIEFQFHEALCQAASQFDPSDPASKPLYKCDIHGSLEAGEKLMKMLQLGSSEPWPVAMDIMTGQSEMDAGPILDYFRPLIQWLQNENKLNDVTVGWENEIPFCKSTTLSTGTRNICSPYLLIVLPITYYMTDYHSM